MVAGFDELCFNWDGHTHRLSWLSGIRGSEDSFGVEMFEGALSVISIGAAFGLDS